VISVGKIEIEITRDVYDELLRFGEGRPVSETLENLIRCTKAE